MDTFCSVQTDSQRQKKLILDHLKVEEYITPDYLQELRAMYVSIRKQLRDTKEHSGEREVIDNLSNLLLTVEVIGRSVKKFPRVRLV